MYLTGEIHSKICRPIFRPRALLFQRCLPRAKPRPFRKVLISAKELLHLGSRAAVDQALKRLEARNELMRLVRGVYVRPVKTRFGVRAPSAKRVVEGIAACRAETVVAHGAIPRRNLVRLAERAVDRSMCKGASLFSARRSASRTAGGYWPAGYGIAAMTMAMTVLADSFALYMVDRAPAGGIVQQNGWHVSSRDIVRSEIIDIFQEKNHSRLHSEENMIRADNPCRGFKRPKAPKSDGFHSWTDPEVAQYRGFWPCGTMPRLVMELAVETSARRGDVTRLGPEHILPGQIRSVHGPISARGKLGPCTDPLLS
jgi:Family of unknown function (DUF6088)